MYGEDPHPLQRNMESSRIGQLHMVYTPKTVFFLDDKSVKSSQWLMMYSNTGLTASQKETWALTEIRQQFKVQFSPV